MLYKITNIRYCIEPEDVDHNEDDYDTHSDYLADCEKVIEATRESLPKELLVTLDDDSDGDLEDDLANAISDETGWLTEGFSYEKQMQLTDVKVGDMFVVKNLARNQNLRARREDEDNVFVYAPKKKRYGWRYSNAEFERNYKIVPPKKTPEEEWHHRLDRAIKAMEGSGLWENVLERCRNLRRMSYEDLQALRQVYWGNRIYLFTNPSLNKDPLLPSKIADFKSAVAPFAGKYPFAFHETDYELADGTKGTYPEILHEYIFESADCKLKAMYFGKYENANAKNRIRTFLNNKEKLSVRSRTSYDVSFEYDPERNMAWYSEEYKDCGNGHYYLALNDSLAMFYEDD